jgi:selenocysteine lyase/cysteine desulfurase
MPAIAAVRLEAVASAQQSAEEVAVIEPFWREVRQQFTLDPVLMNLDNAGGSPSPVTVHEAYKRHLDQVNRLPAHYRAHFEAQITDIRRDLAQELGCEPPELTLTGGTEAPLGLAVMGIELGEGDEVISLDRGESRAQWMWDQRARREGIAVRRVELPTGATRADVLARVQAVVTPRTRVLHFAHVTTTGQLLPVGDLGRMARPRKIVTVVDGGQAVGQFPFALRELECDVYAARLDAWMMGPQGTGLLYVRSGVDVQRPDPIMAGSEAAAVAALAEALTFHRAVGPERKAARLRYLTLRWVNGLRSRPQVQIVSGEPMTTWGLGAFTINRLPAPAVVTALREKHSIVVSHDAAVRVSPNVYTSVEEIDRFIAAVRSLL